MEIAKEALADPTNELRRRETQAVLAFVVERSLRLLHPFVPHVTEELWHALPHPDALLATSPWPAGDEVTPDPIAEVEIEPVLESIRLIRNVRAEEKIPPTDRPIAWVRAAGPEVARILRAEQSTIARLARLGAISFLEIDGAPPVPTVGRVATLGEWFLARPPRSATGSDGLERERAKLADLLARTRERLADPGFRGRAPPEVVREAETKATELTERIGRIDAQLKEAGASAP